MDQNKSQQIAKQFSHGIQFIEWNMLDKKKYFPFTLLSGFFVRGALYPLTVVKTRIQIQKYNSEYKGTLDAILKINKAEGPKGLYSGFWLNNMQLFSSIFYITTYENVRYYLRSINLNRQTRAFLAGGSAALAGQTILVPIDNITQYLMVIGRNPQSRIGHLKVLGITTLTDQHGKAQSVIGLIAKGIHNRFGLTGFYKGYGASLSVMIPSNAIWWSSYDIYGSFLAQHLGDKLPLLVIQCISGCLAGVSSATLTNPLDAIRARMQVERRTFVTVFSELLKEEKFRILVKGLSPRLIQSVCFSFLIISGYETVKRMSIKKEFQEHVRW